MLWIAVFIGVLWLGCGVSAAILDKKDCPEPVIPIADALLRIALIGGGPAGLLAILFMRGTGDEPLHD